MGARYIIRTPLGDFFLLEDNKTIGDYFSIYQFQKKIEIWGCQNQIAGSQSRDTLAAVSTP